MPNVGTAIIGIGCLLPKARDLGAYWDNILNRVDAVGEVPTDRWDWRSYFSEDQKARDKVYSRWGGFLDEIAFDPLRYGMQPSSVPSTEPVQLLTLEAVRMALEDAGYADRPFCRERTSVILGVGGGTADLGLRYAFRSAVPMFSATIPPGIMEMLPEWTENSFPGILLNLVAGRVANRFDLGGVNYTIDAACASSLAAVYLSVRELESGTSDLVITGGADTLQSPFAYLCFSKTNALSPRGRCRAFDESADGIAISEGLAILVLKRLPDAERDGDRIYAVIRGIAGSSDGKERTLTAPSHDGQIRALERAYTEAGISPANVGLVEAHGTGTVVGDRVEIEALSQVYRNAGAKPRSCAVGSVKSNLGHTKSAAGAAGLAKAALALHCKILPATIGVSSPNKVLQQESPFYVNTESRPWVAWTNGTPRCAAVSAFGFGGTNFHAVLEEYTGGAGPALKDMPGQDWPSELLVITGGSKSELESILSTIDDALAQGANPALADLGYTFWRIAESAQAEARRLKLGLIAGSLGDLRQQISVAAELISKAPEGPTQDERGIYFSGIRPQYSPKLAFLFPGQGSQYPGMLSELAVRFSEVREEFEVANRVLAGRAPSPLSEYVFPPPGFSAEEDRAAWQKLTMTDVVQPALGVAETALLRLLTGFGLEADMAAGHSYGEYVALSAAGVFSKETLYSLSEARGRFIRESAASGSSGMAAVDADRNTVCDLLISVDSVCIANLNAPNQTVISGTKSSMEEASARLKAAGLTVRELAVSCAFHSPLMAPVRDRLADLLSRQTFSPAKFPVFSNSTSLPYPANPVAIASLLTDHLVKPVDFAGEIEAMYAAGARVFVEVGPRNVLTGLVGQILGYRRHFAMALDVFGRSGLSQLQRVVGHLVTLGVPVQLDRFYRSRKVRQLRLPSLVEDTRTPAVSPTTWFVNGGRARPTSGSRPENSRERVTTMRADSNGSVPELPRDVPPALSQPAVTSMVSVSSDDANDALTQFHQVITKIMDTQREVMLAYLQSDHHVSHSQPGIPAIAQTSPAKPPPDVTRRDPAQMRKKPTGSRSFSTKPTEDGQGLGVRDLLIRIASEKTGYPEAALGLDLKIEADLGVDSLKIAEILTAFVAALKPSEQLLIRGSMEDITKASTLGAMVKLIDAVLSRAKLSGSEMNSAQSPHREIPLSTGFEETGFTASERVPRSKLAPVEAPIRKYSALEKGSILITDDEQGVASIVAEKLRYRGIRVSLVRFGHAFTTDAANSYTADLSDPTAVSQLLDCVRRYEGRLSGIIHLLPLRPGRAFDSGDWTNWQARIHLDIKSFFLLASGSAVDIKGNASSGSSLLVAATMGGAFDTPPATSSFPTLGGLSAIVKCLSLEWTGVRCKAIDFGSDQAPSQVANLLIEEIGADDEVEVGFRESRRLILRSAPAGRDSILKTASAIHSDNVILVIGGGHGITAEVALDLATRCKPTLLIVGRSRPEIAEDPTTARLTTPQEVKAALFHSMAAQGMTPLQIDEESRYLFRNRETRRNLQAMREAGADVRYFSVDVREEAAFSGLIRSLYRAYGSIDGVIHGAGIIEDKLIEDKDPKSFDRVFDTKVNSAFVLSRTIDPGSLKFLVFFSSIASCFGNRGQADYAAANGVLDQLAAYLDRTWPANVFSINWGPWSQTGMVSPSVYTQFVARGIEPIAPSDGVWSLDWELRYRTKGEGSVILGRGPWCARQMAAVP